MLATTYPRGCNASLPAAEAGVSYRQYDLGAPPFTDVLGGEPTQLFDDEYDVAERDRNPMALGLWRLA